MYRPTPRRELDEILSQVHDINRGIDDIDRDVQSIGKPDPYIEEMRSAPHQPPRAKPAPFKRRSYLNSSTLPLQPDSQRSYIQQNPTSSHLPDYNSVYQPTPSPMPEFNYS